MSNDKPIESGEATLQPIPEEWQEITLDELVEADYEVAPISDEETDEQEPMRRYHGSLTNPGRVWNDDSIDASSDDPRGTNQGYVFTGFDTEAATRIGDENRDAGEHVERLRELNEGRHRTDGNHSVREHRRDKKRLIDAICSSLPLASIEREIVGRVVEKLDFDQFGYQKGIQRVILAAVVVVIDEEHRDSDVFDDLVSQSDAFRSMCDALDISMSDLATIKMTIRKQLNEGKVLIPSGRKVPKRDPSLPGPTRKDELPSEYWENLTVQGWARMAQHWEKIPTDTRDAVPEKYRKRIKQLRRWEPWTKEDKQQDNRRPLNDQDTEVNPLPDDLDEEIEREAAELVAEMKKESDVETAE